MKGWAEFRGLMLALALAALGVRAVVPTGYMLANDAGSVSVALCGGGEMRLHLGGHQQRDQDSTQNADRHCVFAASVAAPPPALVTVDAPRHSIAIATHGSADRATAVTTLAAPPPPATGPPLSI